MQKIQELTKTDWERFGAETKVVRDMVLRHYITVCNRLGKSASEARKAKRIMEQMDELKSDLDNLVADVDYNKGLWTYVNEDVTKIFYGAIAPDKEQYAFDFIDATMENLLN